MWRWYTADDRRQVAAVTALLVTVSGVVLGLGLVLTGLLLTSLLSRDEAPVGLGDWPTVLVRLGRHPAAPGEAFGAERLSPIGYWIVAVLVSLLLGWACSHLMRHGFRVLAPTGTGFASRRDIADELSGTVCRRRAAVTRPDLTRRQTRRVPLVQVGIPLHRAAVTRTELWLPLENATGVIAPQQSGKTLMDLIHKVLAAPGGLIVTSTKLDLYLHTALARHHAGSPVQVLDLTGAVAWPQRVRWNPIAGCTTVTIAKRTNLHDWSPEQVQLAAAELNTRPRMCLDDLTPDQAMRKSLRHQFTRPVRNHP